MKTIEELELSIPDRDELKEYYGFTYRSEDNWRRITTKKTEMSFEADSLQDVLENFHTFLNTVGFSYVGKVTLESKDGKKIWTT